MIKKPKQIWSELYLKIRNICRASKKWIEKFFIIPVK